MPALTLPPPAEEQLIYSPQSAAGAAVATAGPAPTVTDNSDPDYGPSVSIAEQIPQSANVQRHSEVRPRLRLSFFRTRFAPSSLSLSPSLSLFPFLSLSLSLSLSIRDSPPPLLRKENSGYGCRPEVRPRLRLSPATPRASASVVTDGCRQLRPVPTAFTAFESYSLWQNRVSPPPSAFESTCTFDVEPCDRRRCLLPSCGSAPSCWRRRFW